MLTPEAGKLLYIPPLLSAVSFAYISCVLFYRYFFIAKPKDQVQCLTLLRNLHDLLKEVDGLAILSFRCLRLACTLVLLSLELYRWNGGQTSEACIYQILFWFYASVLSMLTTFSPVPWRDIISRQLAILLFSEFVVFFVLDVWPYATLYLEPFDPLSNPLTWVRLSLITLGGLVIPLVMPRPFRATAVNDRPSAQKTASLLSRYSYSYLDPIVYHAFRVPDIKIEDMPQIPGEGRIEVLAKRALDALDPVKVGKRHMFWGTWETWRKDYIGVLVWLGVQALTEFIGPFGTQNLLKYLESGAHPFNLKPWIWIVVLTAGPVIAGCCSTQYLFIGTRIFVEQQSVLSYVIFHHALRIRMKSTIEAEEDKTKKAEPSREPSTTTQSSASTTDVSESEVSDTESTAVDDSSEETIVAEKSNKPKADHLLGKINNLLTTDLNAISNSYNNLTLSATVIQFILSIYYLYILVGWSSLVGLTVMIILSPAPAFMGKQMVKIQQVKMKFTDKRVQAVTEALGILRMIKLFGWEPYMMKQLAQRRGEELRELKKFRIFQALLNVSNSLIPLLGKISVISVYTLVSKGDLEASRIFTALMIFSMMEEQLFGIMYAIPGFLRAKVSFDRFTEFLNTTELISEGNSSETFKCPEEHARSIGFKSCSFSWEAFDDSLEGNGKSPERSRRSKSRKKFCLRIDDQLLFKRDHINIIVGPTASGKTSILMALLGEMYYKPHGPDSWYNLPREEGIAYAPQESWVLNRTIKDNIIFGEPFNEDRYKKVLYQCALEKDLDLWEARDLTEVGEKGLTLSGGQKARVTLARALYSSSSIILLDDVLAALDVHTSKWIIDKALSGELVKGRTVILVTHNIALAAPIAAYVVVLSRNGSISAQGSVSDVLQTVTSLRTQMEKEIEEETENIELEIEENGKDKEETKTDTVDAKKSTGKLVLEEEKAMGRVELKAIMLYVSSVGGSLIWAVILGSRLAEQTFQLMQSWFVGYWSNQYATHPASEIPVVRYVILFALASIASCSTDFGASLFWVYKTNRASKIIHDQLIKSVFTSTFRWLDITPVGRITTRCTQDMNTIDDQLSLFARMFISITINLICLFFSSVVMAGWYALISGLTVFILGGTLGRIYLKCQISTRREMSNAKAPVMTLVGTALAGLSTIRAYGAQTAFSDELKEKIDILSRSSYCFYDINRWVSIRMDTLGSIFSCIVASYLVFSGKLEAGFAGFTISVVLSFSRMILYWIRIYNLLEIQANSLERMLDFMRIDHEPEATENGKPPAYWPSSGDLRAEKLSARYSDDSPEILRELDFHIKSGERVGVVGRTGAGKSSIALALLRAIKTTGKVYYDGIATDEINLDALRTNITLIPQQPELIHGSLRENLDPLQLHDDATLYDALNSSGFYSIKELETKKGESSASTSHAAHDAPAEGSTEHRNEHEHESKVDLDTMVESGGTNFSLGQRQIIALARAIVRRSKLIILDEATAAIDYDTDAAIQKTLRSEFSKDTTLITIAHRLQTIIDYDKIMVLDAGQIVEFDQPARLLENENGHFRALIDGSEERELLRGMAAEAKKVVV